MEPEVFNGTLQFPSTMIICGVSGSGKTEFMLDLISKRDVVYGQKIPNVVFIYSTYQKRYDEFSNANIEVKFISINDLNGIPDNNGIATLLIFDDLMMEFSADKHLKSLITEVFT
jgi:ABC-type lipoprotein export system ATPase subunit